MQPASLKALPRPGPRVVSSLFLVLLALLALPAPPHHAARADTTTCGKPTVPTPTVVASVTSVVFRLAPALADVSASSVCAVDLWVDAVSSSLFIDELRVYLSFPADTFEVTDAQGRPAVEVLTTAFGTVTRNQVDGQAGRVDLALGPGSVGQRGSFLIARLYVRGRRETGSTYVPLAFDRDVESGRVTSAYRAGTPVVVTVQDGRYRVAGTPRLAGRVRFQAGPTAAGPVAVEFVAAGVPPPATPLATVVTQPAADGSFTVQAPAAGTYDVRVRAVRSGVSAALPVRASGVTVPAESTVQVEFGCLREGDADGDGDVDGAGSGTTSGDADILLQWFDRRVPTPGAGADFDRSGAVTIVDFSLLAASYGMGEQRAPAPCD